MVSVVSAVSCNSYDLELVYNSVKKALSDIDFKFKEKSVLIKPNIVTPLSPEHAATTHPSILDAICRILTENDCNITIGESSGDDKTINAFDIAGVKDIAEKYNAQLLSFELCKPILSEINGKILKSAYIAEPVINSDLVINIPKLKTHAFMGLSGAVKNLLGVMPGAQKQKMHVKAVTMQEFTQLILDLYNFVKPGLNIIDGVIGMDGGGPVKGKPKKTGYVLASTDAIALDIIAQELVGLQNSYYYNKIKPYRQEIKLKGSISPVKYNTATSFFDDSGFLPYKLKKFNRKFVIGKPNLVRDKCDKCGLCEQICKFDALKLKPYPNFNRHNCIKCYGCYEVCPKNAIFIEKNIIARQILKLRGAILSLK